MSASGVRPVKVSEYSLAAPGGKRSPRTIPAPWIDCGTCGLRHYPSTSRSRWYIATTCVSCGTALEELHA